MNIGIIGYGSMGKMLAQKFLESGRADKNTLSISNRTKERLQEIADKASVCASNSEAAENADILFVCVRPCDIKEVVTEINGSLKKDSLLVSLNGNITFEMLEKIAPRTTEVRWRFGSTRQTAFQRSTLTTTMNGCFVSRANTQLPLTEKNMHFTQATSFSFRKAVCREEE